MANNIGTNPLFNIHNSSTPIHPLFAIKEMVDAPFPIFTKLAEPGSAERDDWGGVV
jgi:hypothetical protein